MNLDDIEREFWGDQREQPTRVRLRRVVEALRDEIASQFGFNESWNVGAVVGAFDDILASDGVEAAGDVNPDGARISGLEITAPAASGSPAASAPRLPGGRAARADYSNLRETQRTLGSEAMTLDDLRTINNCTYHKFLNDTEGCENQFPDAIVEAERAGIRAVVEALRDEIASQFGFNERWNAAAVVGAFDEILASDGVEAAGGSAREDEKAVEAVGDDGPVTVNSPAADCCKICGGSGSTPDTLICPGCDGSGEERPCVWVDEMPSPGDGYGYLRQWRNSTCGRPEWGSTDYTPETLGNPLRCQCGRLIEIAGEIHLGRILPKIEGHTT